MAWREKLQALKDSLRALEEEEFLDSLMFLEGTPKAIRKPARYLLDPKLKQSLNEQELLGFENFLEILSDLKDCLKDLNPSFVRVCLSCLKSVVKDLLKSLKDADPAESAAAPSETDGLQDILLILKQLRPGYRLQCLEHLSEIVQEVSPMKPFIPPSICLRSPTLDILNVLEELDELYFLTPKISRQLLFLNAFRYQSMFPLR